MKLKINDEVEEPIVKLELCQLFGNSITVKATLANGESNYLISFRADGTFYRHTSVFDDVGFQVEPDGRLVEA